MQSGIMQSGRKTKNISKNREWMEYIKVCGVNRLSRVREIKKKRSGG